MSYNFLIFITTVIKYAIIILLNKNFGGEKVKKKVVFLFFVLFTILSAKPVSAIESISSSAFNQDGFEVKVETTKDNYKKNESVDLNLTIKNNNNFSINNITISSLIPDTLKLKEAIPDIVIKELKPNETYSLSNPITMKFSSSELENNNETIGENPELENDSSTIGKDSVIVKPENDSKNKTNFPDIITDLSEKNNQLIHIKKKQSDLLGLGKNSVSE